MLQYLPISGSPSVVLADLSTLKDVIELQSEDLLRQVDSKKLELPSTLEQLDRETVDIIDLSVDTALALKIPFGATDNKLQRRIYIQEYKKYRELTEGDQVIHTGIAIRWVVNILKLNNNADLSSLPLVTASAEFNNLKASVRFEVVGLSSPDITNYLPSNVDLKTETYVTLKNAFEKIKSKIWDKDTQVHPTVLGMFGNVKTPATDRLADAIGITYALNKIKEGKTLARALGSLGVSSSLNKELITSVYQELLGTDSLETEPSDEVVEKVKELLRQG